MLKPIGIEKQTAIYHHSGYANSNDDQLTEFHFDNYTFHIMTVE